MLATLRRSTLIGILALGASACSFWSKVRITGSGNAASETRAVQAFDRIEVAGSFEVQVRAGDGAHTELVIESDDNLFEYIETEVEGRTLEVEVRDGYSLSPRPRLVIVTGDLRSLSIAGSAFVEMSGLAGGTFALEIAGSGEVRANGEVDTVEIAIAGSGEVSMTGLQARRAEVEIAGSGDVELCASERLEISIAGSGEVRYVGEPEVRQSVAGSGSIKRISNADA